MRNFDDVWDNMAGGFGLALLIGVLGLVFGCIIFSDHRDDAVTYQKFYYALAGHGHNTDDVRANEAGTIIKMIIREDLGYQRSIELYGRLSDMDNANSLKFLNVLKADTARVADIALGKKPARIVALPKPWSIFWKWYLPILWLLICGLCVAQWGLESSFPDDSFFDLPWHRPWLYPFLIGLAPGMTVVMTFEFCLRPRKSFHRFWKFWVIDRRPIRAQPAVAVTTNATPEIEGQTGVDDEMETTYANADSDFVQRIEAYKRDAFERIKGVHARYAEFEREFIENYSLAKQKEWLQNIQTRLRFSRNDLTDLGQKIKARQQVLATTQKELVEQERLIAELRESSHEVYRRDWRRLSHMPLVKAAEIDGNTIKVYTDTIYVDYRSKRYEIGMFIISIRADNTIYTENLSSTHPGRQHHPYAQQGWFCWGAMAHPITRALQNREYEVALTYVFKAMQSAQGDNESYVTTWKEVKYGKKKKGLRGKMAEPARDSVQA